MDAQQSGAVELSDYLTMLRRRWWVVVLAAVIGVALAGVFLIIAPKSYTSTASVYVQQTDLKEVGGAAPTESRDVSGVNLDTEAQLVKSYDVADRAKKLMRTSIPTDDLIEDVSVEVPPNTVVLAISYDGDSPAAAQHGAHAFAQSYLANRTGQINGQIKSQVNKLNGQLTGLQKKLRGLSGKLSTLTGSSPTKAFTEQQQTLVSDQISDLYKKLQPLKTADVTPGRIITDADLPDSPSSPQPLLFLGSGLLIGLLAGLFIAYFRERNDKYVRDARDIDRMGELPVLLDLDTKHNPGSLGLLTSRSRAGQSFHELAHSLTATLGHGSHVIQVTGAAPGRAGNVVAINTAAALARIESGVVLLCADLHSSISGDLLGLLDGPGLAEVLLDRVELGDVEQRAGQLPALRVVPPGHEGELAADMLQRDIMSSTVNRLRTMARYIVIEAPSTAAGADAQALAEIADAAVIAVEVPRTEKEQINEAYGQLNRMGAAVLGAVVLPYQGKPSVPQPRPVPAAARRDRGTPGPETRRPAALPPSGGGSSETREMRKVASLNDGDPSRLRPSASGGGAPGPGAPSSGTSAFDHTPGDGENSDDPTTRSRR